MSQMSYTHMVPYYSPHKMEQSSKTGNNMDEPLR